MTLYLTNSITHRLEAFEPIDPENVRLYLCGPTVYDRAHMGNVRNVLMFDILYRVLRHEYGAEHVTYARNFTDVDDKINARAQETGRSISEITEETIQWYTEDIGALGVLTPNHQPRATQYIDEMLGLIDKLMKKGHAYEVEGHVLFAVDSFKDYGKLSGRSIDDMIAGARVEVAPYKRNPMDFVLWKPSSPDLPGWDSPYGRGRPGWHIECSAMSHALLGEAFDIHGGGNDLMFPHHENEIAQSCCGYGSDFVNVWLHNEMLLVEGRKMSKSLGNFFTVRDVLDQGVPGEVIRMVFMGTHYRKPMDWTAKRVEEATTALRKWGKAIAGVAPGPVADEVLVALKDDLNTPAAIAQLHALYKAERWAELAGSAHFMGILTPEMHAWAAAPDASAYSARIEALLAERLAARASRDFERADVIRDGLIAAGVVVKDGKEGAVWELSPTFDAARLVELSDG